MKKTVSQKTAERLAMTPKGCALLGLIREHGTPAALADHLDLHQQIVRDWIYKGHIPRPSAIRAAEIIGIDPQVLRPDLCFDAPEPKPERAVQEPVARTADARLLVRLAKKMGGVDALCAAIHCTKTDYHNWKCRGRIPAIKLPTVLELDR